MLKNKYLKSVLISWIPLAIVITFLCGLIYVSTHQNYRMSANDPQIQLAEEVAREIVNGQSASAFIPARQLQLENTLATYILIFDEQKKLVGSSVSLNGKDPVIPQGVLNTAKEKGENSVTWEPQKGVRGALIVKYFNGKESGFVAVGRSIREIEKREDRLLKTVFLAYIVTLLGSFLSLFFLQKFK